MGYCSLQPRGTCGMTQLWSHGSYPFPPLGALLFENLARFGNEDGQSWFRIIDPTNTFMSHTPRSGKGVLPNCRTAWYTGTQKMLPNKKKRTQDV